MGTQKASLACLVGLLVCATAVCAGALTVPQRAAEKARLDRLVARYMKSVTFWAGLQHGGWCVRYSARTRLPVVGPRCRECDPGTVHLSGKGNTEPVAWALLKAYETTGEPKLLEVARKVGDYLIEAQFPDGHWSAMSIVDDDGKVVPAHTHGVGGYIGLEDYVQHWPVYTLAYLYRITKEQKYLDAAVRGAEILIETQNPNGSFPQYYDPVKKRPAGYGYAVINDHASIEPILVFELIYMITGDEKFLKPIPKVGDWLISAYRKGKVMRGWAQQYDKDNKPCWARPFEPPTWSLQATMQAMMGLFEVHALTRDEKYIEPIRDALPALERTVVKGKGWHTYVDWDTGKQVLAQGYKVSVRPETTPDWARGLRMAIPLHRVRDRLKGWDEKRAISLISFRGAYVPKMPGPLKTTGGSIEHHLDRLEKALNAATPEGYTVRRHPDGDRISPAYDLLNPSRILQRIAISQGKLPPHYGTRSRYIHYRVWPDGDWYNTPLRRDGGYKPGKTEALKPTAAPPAPRPAPAEVLQEKAAEPTGVTFRCAFEDAHCDAGRSAGRPEQNGRDWRHAKGRSGKGILFDKPDAYARYVGLRNVPVKRGTVSLWVRSKPGTNIWKDGKDHCVLVLQTKAFVHPENDPRRHLANHQLWLVKRGKGNVLELSLQRGIHDHRQPLGRVAASVADLKPDEWHRIQASWDNAGKRIALSVNGAKPGTATTKANVAPRAWVLFYVGNSHIYRVRKPLGGIVDDLEFSTRALQ